MSKRKQNQGTIERLVNWVASFRRVDGVELPQDGRSSVDSGAGLAAGVLAMGTVIPRVPHLFETLRSLEKFSVCNPDFSQVVGNMVALGNTGHTITVDASTEALADAALTRINEAAPRLYPNAAGIDGLINAYIRQSMVSGAISSEDVVDLPGKRVAKVVIVPVDEIRFRRVDGEYRAYQQPKNWLAARRDQRNGPLGLVELNPNTYHYYAIETVENCPYARPPGIAAVDMLEGAQKDAIENLSWIVRKLGILGLVIVNLTKPKVKPGESDAEFHARAQRYLTAVREVLDGNFKKGLLVAFNDQKFDHANVASDARGAGDIFQVIEELVCSGMGAMPWELGRNYTTTETFADVAFNIKLSQMTNHQRLAKRRVERTYDLDLMLAGIAVDNVTVEFNRAEARDVSKKAQADQTIQQMIFERAEKGIISADKAAQELGYEKAEDPELLSAGRDVAKLSARGLWANERSKVTATCRFDRNSQRYEHVPSRLSIAADPIGAEENSDQNSVVRGQFKKKAA
jgi:hypothetical protein